MGERAARNDRGGMVAAAAALYLLVGFGGSAGTLSAAESRSWPHATYYTVVAHPGDTVAKIALRYRVSVSAIGKFNELTSASRIRQGQVLRIPATTRATREAVLFEAVSRSAQNYAPGPKPPMFTRLHDVRYSPVGREASSAQERTGLQFLWPLSGTVISPFGPDKHGSRNDGINIAAKLGMPFRAAAPGTVCYAGALRGYGNLILITHPNGYVTAYAHADNIAVARGEEVGRGQVIGTAGNTGRVDRPQLRFEIRRGISPIDPRLLLVAGS
jgi:murein DD-endopeptidase MepM/ murein hydrolase activator NlpD